MGITQTSLDRINRYLQPHDQMLIVGCQNLYNAGNYGEIAHVYFENKGHRVVSIDITGCQGSGIVDLREPQPINPDNDLILQHGTIEHIDGSIYEAFNTFHKATKVGGVMIHENPKTENWPGHGYHYFTDDFYIALAFLAGYEIKELTSEPAMGNTTDGWNVSAVLAKAFSGDFITEEQFNQIYNDYVRSK